VQSTLFNEEILLNEEHNSNLIFNNRKEKSVFNLWALSQPDAFKFEVTAEFPPD
jgi:hypothetical protein